MLLNNTNQELTCCALSLRLWSLVFFDSKRLNLLVYTCNTKKKKKKKKKEKKEGFIMYLSWVIL